MARRVCALAGGVGAARFLQGLVQVVDPRELSVVVNTGDDRDFHGLRICPDLDIITYTLAGRVNADTGWGLVDETWNTLCELQKFGHETWFQLGDRDLATHIHRSERLRAGAGLTEVTREITRAFELELELIPMTEADAPTFVVRKGERRTHFEEYLVRDRAPDDVIETDLAAARASEPAPGVLEAIRGAEILLLCPSNPIVSIGPIRAVAGVEAELRARSDAVAVSPIIGGAPVKGPAHHLMPAAGYEVSARGVAEIYREILMGLVIDREDTGLAGEIRELGLQVRIENTLMKTSEIAAAVARATLELASS